MVTKVMPIFRLELTNRDQRSATDGMKKKPESNAAFKEVFSKELASIARR